MYKPPGTTEKDKFEHRWEEGVWLGVADRTNEVIVGTSEGGNQGEWFEETWH